MDRRSEDDERQINRWKKIVSRFRGKLVKMIKDVDSKFDDYSISPKIKQVLLHWGYELTEKDFLLICQTNTQKMSYYQFNRQEILQKAKERYSKEKAAEYYLENKEAIKEKSKNQYKNLSKEEKDKIKEYQRERYLQSIIKMREKTLKFDNIKIDKKELINLNSQ